MPSHAAGNRAGGFDDPLPTFVPEQIAQYQTDLLLRHEICAFDVRRAIDQIPSAGDVMTIDIGGDKARVARYASRNGHLVKLDEEVLHSSGGAGYLAFLEHQAREAADGTLRVGISSATKLDGSIVQRTVNLPVFFDEFTTQYNADFSRLFHGRSIAVNDTIAGICGSSLRLAEKERHPENIAFVICASGVGASVLQDGMATHVEAAHVPLVDSLNPMGQRTPCGVEGRSYVCVERVTAARAGIEDLYLQQTGERMDGRDLGTMYEAGDFLATRLYDISAVVLAHATAGIAERYRFTGPATSVVVYHGGNFEIGRYRKAVARSLGCIPATQPEVIYARDLSDNVCLDGAAILAVEAMHSPDR